MAIAQVQKAAAVSNAVAFGSNNTAGNLLVALIGVSNNVTGVTDTAGNTWVKAVEQDNSSDGLQFTEIWYVASCASGANTVTAANGFGSSFAHIAVVEYSGCDATPLDKTATDYGFRVPSNTPTSGATATTSQADEVLVGVIANVMAASTTWDAGWTEQYDDATAGAGRSMAWAEQIVSATGTYAASGSAYSSSGWQACIATFKAAAGGAAGHPAMRRVGREIHGVEGVTVY